MADIKYTDLGGLEHFSDKIQSILDDKANISSLGSYAYKSGSNASGTWPISITGNAATATSAVTANSASLLGDKPLSALVKINKDNRVYTDVSHLYMAGTTPTYYRIVFPDNVLTAYNMVNIEVFFRQKYSDNTGGKIIINTHNPTNKTWNGINAYVYGYFSTNIKVYGYGGKYIYIEGCTSWSTINIDKILIGDNAVYQDQSSIIIDYVSSLPEGYTTASMYYSYHSGNLSKSTLGLGNVENTALSSWSGSSNLTTCNKGVFGSIITKNSGDYLSITGGTLTGNLTVAGNLTVNGTSINAKNYVFMNNGGDGVYIHSSGLSWHDSNNAYVAGLINCASNSITLGQSTTIDGTLTSSNIYISKETDQYGLLSIGNPNEGNRVIVHNSAVGNGITSRIAELSLYSASGRIGGIGVYSGGPIFIDNASKVTKLSLEGHTHNYWTYNADTIKAVKVNNASNADSAGIAERLGKTWKEDINYSSGSNLKIISNSTGTTGNFASGWQSGISVMSDYVGWQLTSYGGGEEHPYFRSLQDNGNWKTWRQLAFLSDIPALTWSNITEKPTSFGGKNIMTLVVNGGYSTGTNGKNQYMSFNMTNADTYFYIQLSEDIKRDEKLVFSFDVSGITVSGFKWTWAWNNNTKYGGITITGNGRYTMYVTSHDNVSAGTNILIDDGTRTYNGQTATVTFNNFKVERGTIATDYSPNPNYLVRTNDANTINGILTIAPSNKSAHQDGLVLHDSGGGGSEALRIRWTSGSYTDGVTLVGKPDTNTLEFNGNNVCHAGNSSVSLSGQTLTVKINGTEKSLTNSTYSFSDNNPTLSWSTKSKVATVGGTDIHVTMPSKPTYTYSDVGAAPASHSHLDTFNIEYNNNYVALSFRDTEISKIAGEKYIECWDSAGGWWNWMANKWITVGGTSTNFVKGDGSLDSNSYSVVGHTHNYWTYNENTIKAVKVNNAGNADTASGLTRNTSNFSVSSAGWYKLAYINTTDARGSVRLGIYTVGGDYTPRYSELKVSNGWSIIEFCHNGRFDWITKYRYTKDSTKSYIEAYFSGKCAVYLTIGKGVMYVDDISNNWTLYSAATAGSGTVEQSFDKPTSSSSFFVSGNISTASSMTAANGFFQSSDERLKTFYDPIEIDLDKLKTLRKNYFKFNDKDKIDIGVSAQEIKEIYPEIVTENDDGYLSVAYDKLSVVALAAVDKLDDEIDELKERILKLEKIIEKLA